LSGFVNRNFSYLLHDNKNLEELRAFRREKIKAVPILSKEGKILEIIDFSVTKSLLPIDAVVMAGGLGSRLKPLTDQIPKPLLKIGKKEIISYIIDRLYQYGICNQKITVNYLGDMIENFCKNYNKEITFEIIKETDKLGTAGALSLIENFTNDTILLLNSDLLTNINYEEFFQAFQESDADMMVASVPYDVSLPYAILDTQKGEPTISSFKEKPKYTHYASTGIYLMKKPIIRKMPKNRYFNATDLMNLVIDSSGKLVHFPITGYWLDIGRHEDLEKAQRDIAHIEFD
ncbi:sugar phosphate nucleotidyltransferase, partial [Akkermansiaceae bacterium]|nr:sugar phosphate nucleotidyltransferase [Akkermansiaceae bacterium]